MKALPKLSRWLLFTVLLSVIPAVYTILKLLTFSRPVTLASFGSHGELLPIATAAGGVAIGELIGSGTRKRPLPKVTCAAACLGVIILSVMWFADIVSAQEAGNKVNPEVVSYGSMILLFLTLLAGGGCIALSDA